MTEDNLRQELQQSALEMARRGWHVFPCRGKRPFLRGNWQQQATTERQVIREWWSTWPLNIGVACGLSGLVVLDLDVPGHGDPGAAQGLLSGADHFKRLCAANGQPVPETMTVQTPSGGTHHYFAASPGVSIRNSVSRLTPLVDVRGVGGYVIAPPSRSSDGGRYYFQSDIEPAPLPDWIGELLSPRNPGAAPRATFADLPRNPGAYGHAALVGETRRVASAPEGARNNTLFLAAFHLGQLTIAGVVTEHAVTDALTEAALHAGLTPQETARTIRSGLSTGARHPRQVHRNGPGRAQRPSRFIQTDGLSRSGCWSMNRERRHTTTSADCSMTCTHCRPRISSCRSSRPSAPSPAGWPARATRTRQPWPS